MFGMGTGVTLAVYSPANLGVLQGCVTPCVCSNNLNQSCKNTPLSFWGAWQSLPCSRNEFRLVFLRFSRGKLAPCNLIFHNEIDWARSCRSFRSYKAC